MINLLKSLFYLNAGLFALYLSLSTCANILQNLHWQYDYSMAGDLAFCIVFTVITIRFVQINLRLFPNGLEADFWKTFAMSFPRLRRWSVFCLITYQAILLWWTPALVRMPNLAGELVSYTLVTVGQVESAERIYALTHKDDGSSFAAKSTYALMNRGDRRADDLRIDEAIEKVYGEKSPQMHERKRLLADFVLMTEGEVPRVEKLRKEAKAIDPGKYTWKFPYNYLIGEKQYFYGNEKYPELRNEFFPKPKVEKNITAQSFEVPCGGLIGAPVDPRYGQIWINAPKIFALPYPKESDGRPATTRLSYRAQFRDQPFVKDKVTEAIAALTLLFIPASFLMSFGLSHARRRLFDYLSSRWSSEITSSIDWNRRFEAANSLVILERLRGNLEQANLASQRMLQLVETIELSDR